MNVGQLIKALSDMPKRRDVMIRVEIDGECNGYLSVSEVKHNSELDRAEIVGWD